MTPFCKNPATFPENSSAFQENWSTFPSAFPCHIRLNPLDASRLSGRDRVLRSQINLARRGYRRLTSGPPGYAASAKHPITAPQPRAALRAIFTGSGVRAAMIFTVIKDSHVGRDGFHAVPDQTLGRARHRTGVLANAEASRIASVPVW